MIYYGNDMIIIEIEETLMIIKNKKKYTYDSNVRRVLK